MPKDGVRAAFEKNVVVLPVGTIVPQKDLNYSHRESKFYQQLQASLKHVGLIEPLVVYPKAPGEYLLLDGHARLEILKVLGIVEVKCLLSTDDEAYSYNKHVNYIPPIAQHFMLLEALKTGLTEERIAEALNLSIESIRIRRDLLNGICPEVVQMLMSKDVSPKIFPVLRKMKPVRQIEAAEHMVVSATYTLSFAQALFAVTKPEMLNAPASPRKLPVTTLATQSMLDEENETLLTNLKKVQESYGVDVLTLTVSCGYVNRLLKNQSIARYLEKNHGGILDALQKLATDVGGEGAKLTGNPM
jgi:ParB-like chromosome segregation protein Spo0J